MNEQQSSYRQIIKATSLFGGVQVFNIIIQIIRFKVIAVLLGPSGVGIIGLLNSTIGLIGSITNFGLGTSAVKDIAAAYSNQDNQRVSIIITVARRLIFITGIFGTLLALIFSPWLSQLTFGNRNYTYAFAWVSLTLFFNQLCSGQLIVLQGLRFLNHLAKASITGSLLSLLLTLPLYFLWGLDGIVPGIIGTSVITYIASWFFSRKIKITSIPINHSQIYFEGKKMLQLGFMISLSGLLTMAASYIVRIYISQTGGVAQVGLYTAGFAIINTYVSLIFTSMSTDYFPRLSSVAYNNKLCKKVINQQAEVSILIITPILIVFLTFINFVILILYTKEFAVVSDMLYWASLGMLFKAVGWSISHIFLAKGASKLFLLNELIANIYQLILNVLGYKLFGLAGLGMSFVISYLLYLLQEFLIGNIMYKFAFENAFLKLFCIQFGLALLCFLSVHFFDSPHTYILGILFIIFSSWYSLKELDKRIGLKSILTNLIKK